MVKNYKNYFTLYFYFHMYWNSQKIDQEPEQILSYFQTFHLKWGKKYNI